MLNMLLLAAHLALAAPPAPSFGHETRTATTSLGTVAYWDVGAGEGTPLVLVHGLPTSKELWADVLPLLPGMRCIVVDLLDFGESRADAPEALDHVQRAQAIEELRAQLGLEKIVLVAHDLGSSVAVDYMGRYGDRVEKLVLMSSPVYPDFQEPDVVDLVRKRWIGMPLLRLMPRTLYRRTLKKGLHHDAQFEDRDMDVFRRDYHGGAGKRRMWQNLSWGTPETFFVAYPEIMRQLAVPTLVLHGARDPFIPTEHAHRMDADIPDSRLILIPDGAHFLPMDTPDAVAEAIRAFLATEPPPG